MFDDLKCFSINSSLISQKSPRRTPIKGKENESISFYNQITPKKNNYEKKLENSMKIFLRVRPRNQNETESCIDVDGNSILLIPPQSLLNGRGQKKIYEFENIFDENTSQKTIFEKTFLNLLPSISEGRDILLFDYGVKGAGKTYTIEGNEKSPGLLPRALNSILSSMKNKNPIDLTHFEELRVTCFEIFNEKLLDLLVLNNLKNKKIKAIEPKIPLNLSRNNDGRTIVEGANEWIITDENQINELLQKANSERHKAETAYNHNSSRSHVVYRLTLLRTNGPPSYISIVDLAGCERTKTFGDERLRESCNINKSMLVLGKCIRSLATKQTAIPFRESLITRLFKDFFESPGKCAVAAVIVNVTPSIDQFDDTSFSLSFAVEASECYTSSIDLSGEDNSKNTTFPMKTDLMFQFQKYMNNIEKCYEDQVSNLMERTRCISKLNSNINESLMMIENSRLKRENEELKIQLQNAMEKIKELSK